MHARIAIAVRDVDVAPGADGYVGRTVERWASALDGASGLAVIAGVRRHVQSAHGHQQPALRGELTHRMVAVIRGEDGAIGGDVNPVRAHGEIALAPGAQEIALAVRDDELVFAAADQEYSILLID